MEGLAVVWCSYNQNWALPRWKVIARSKGKRGLRKRRGKGRDTQVNGVGSVRPSPENTRLGYICYNAAIPSRVNVDDLSRTDVFRSVVTASLSSV